MWVFDNFIIIKSNHLCVVFTHVPFVGYYNSLKIWSHSVWQICNNNRNQEGGKYFFTEFFLSCACRAHIISYLSLSIFPERFSPRLPLATLFHLSFLSFIGSFSHSISSSPFPVSIFLPVLFSLSFFFSSIAFCLLLVWKELYQHDSRRVLTRQREHQSMQHFLIKLHILSLTLSFPLLLYSQFKLEIQNNENIYDC